MSDYISIAEYAQKHGVALVTVRQRCVRGTIPGAIKIGNSWCIPEDAPYEDHRVTSGKYIGSRRSKDKYKDNL